MRILIVAGGGGHFVPALAIIENIHKEDTLLIVGRKYTFEGDSSESLEYQTAKNHGIPFEPITTGRLQRKFTRRTIPSLFKVPYGYIQALKIIKKFKPDIVLSFGGYVSIPVSYAAYTLRIPIVLHEQTLGAGLANKIISKLAARICVSWENSLPFYPEDKTILTGNPLRKEFINHRKTDLHLKNSLPVLYITGGSAGSHAFNLLVEYCLPRLISKYIIIHQSGDAKEFSDYQRLEELRESLPANLQKHYLVVKFVDPAKVADFMGQADLVISRAGIGTITELLYLGKPCLLIPLPYGQQNEQLTNAKFFKETGLGDYAEQASLTQDSFYTKISSMVNNLDEYKKNAAKAKKLVLLDADKKIIEVLKEVVAKKETKLVTK